MTRIINPYEAADRPRREPDLQHAEAALDRMTCHAMRQFLGLSFTKRLKWLLFGAKAFKPKGVPNAPVHPPRDVH